MYGHGQEWITSVDHPSSRHSGINDGDPFHFSQGGDDVPANLFPGPLQDLYEPFDNGPQAMFNPVPQSFEALRVGLHFSIPPETGQNSHIAESTFIDVPQETQGEYLPVGAFDMPLASTFQTTAGQSLHQDQNWNMSQSGAGPAAGDFEGSLFVSNNTIDFNIAPNVMPVDSSEAQPLILPDGYTDGSTDALRGIKYAEVVNSPSSSASPSSSSSLSGFSSDSLSGSSSATLVALSTTDQEDQSAGPQRKVQRRLYDTSCDHCHRRKIRCITDCEGGHCEACRLIAQSDPEHDCSRVRPIKQRGRPKGVKTGQGQNAKKAAKSGTVLHQRTRKIASAVRALEVVVVKGKGRGRCKV